MKTKIEKARDDFRNQGMATLAVALLARMGVDETRSFYDETMKEAARYYEAVIRESVLEEIHASNRALNEAIARKGGV